MLDWKEHQIDYEWHKALNAYNHPGGEHRFWMYEANRAFREVPRLTIWFERERTGSMPKLHRQCSHQEPVEIEDNHLTCCLGVECRKYPHLIALEAIERAPAEIDEIKAWTCVSHILHQQGDSRVDTSEGYILTTSDRMFWDNIYNDLSSFGGGYEPNPDQNDFE